MKKEEKTPVGNNNFGVASVILGILSIVFASALGIILGIIALIFALKQNKIQSNSWSKWGKILSIIGIILSFLLLVLIAIGYTLNPELFAGLQS